MNERVEQITVDGPTADVLRDALYEIDICGPDGEVLGRYRSGKLIDAYNSLKAPEAWSELKRRAREESGCSLDEILARLGVAKCTTK